MVHLKNAYKEITVSEFDAKRYIDLGYVVIDSNGNEIEWTRPMSYEEAKREVERLTAYTKSMQETLNAAYARIDALEGELAKTKRKKARADGKDKG